MQKFKAAFFLSLIIFIAAVAGAQEPIKPEKRDLIRQLLKLIDVKTISLSVMNSVIDQMDKSMPLLLENSIPGAEHIPPEIKAPIMKIVQDFSARMTTRFQKELAEKVNLDEVLEQIHMPLYDRHFSEEDLKQLIAFYQSPIGRKLVSVSPKLQQEATQLSGEILLPKVIELLGEISKEEEPKFREEINRFLSTQPVASPPKGPPPPPARKPDNKN